MKLGGIFAPLTVPLAADDSPALDQLGENIAGYNRTGLAGYVMNGSTGESVLLTWAEIERVWAAAREAAGPGKMMIAGTGAESTPETIAHTGRAAALGYDAALVRTPSYYKPQMNDEALAEHYLRVADASRIPILLYSIPQFTGVAVEAALVEKVAQHKNIIGLKDSSGDVHRIGEIVAAAPVRFQLLVGSASTVYASLRIGAVGAILALACVFPELCAELYAAAHAGQSDEAQRLQVLLTPPSAIFGRLGIPAIKYALDRMGYRGGAPRRPLLPLSAAQAREVDGVLAAVAEQRAALLRAD